MAGSFTTSIPVTDLAPSQRQRLDDALRDEGIPVTWQAGQIQFDQAFEARIETLVAEARSTPPGPAPAGSRHAHLAPPAPPAAPPPTVAAVRPATAPAIGPAPGAYPPPLPPAAYPAYGYRPRVTNSNATLSLLFGILGWVACPILAVLGVIYGRRAQEEIAASAGAQGGDGLARAGSIVSWIVLGIWGFFVVGGLLFIAVLAVLGAATSTT